MIYDEINSLIDQSINESAEKIDIEALSDDLAMVVEPSRADVQELIRDKIKQKARTRIARIKGIDNLREFFAMPTDKRRNLYINSTKSRDATALRKTAERLGVKIAGLENSKNKLLSQAFKLEHNLEIKDDGTIDTKTPYDEKE